MTAATLPIGISRLGQIAINVHDLDRATAFYRDTLGLPLLFTTGALSFFDCGGVRLMLSPPEKPEFDHPSSILYFAVPDIQLSSLLYCTRHRQHTPADAQQRRSLRRRASPNCENANSRFVDDFFPRSGAKPARPDVRDAADKNVGASVPLVQHR